MSQNPQLPDYVASAQPNPQNKRAGWLTTTAAGYAGVMLWFAFWQDVPTGGQGVSGGTLASGLPLAIGALILAALLCHFLYYLVPGLLGMKTGLPLAVVGTSTYGVTGGYLMPGLLMGLLQFGWLSVNAYFAGLLLADPFLAGNLKEAAGTPLHCGIGIVWALIAMFIGLKGIQYVGKISSFMPIIPIVILVILLVKTIGAAGSFDAAKIPDVAENGVKLYGSQSLGVVSLMCTYVIGFFATAGAAGVGFGSANQDKKAVQMGGLVGVVLPTIASGSIALIVVASQSHSGVASTTSLLNTILDDKFGAVCMFLLAISAFPSACFCTLIAADCIKTSFPKINPWVSCGLGVLAAIILVVTGLAGEAGAVFTVIGASFGPICGAMAADYFLSGKKWAGPRAGFNPAGWLSWLFGFIVGGATLVVTNLGGTMPFEIPCPPLSAFIVGFVLYLIFAKAGLESQKLNLPQRIDN
ncbi:MAG: hypothetical protein LBJ67_00240 [Planctomycetaceae bacterium]|jgi:cytosine permease|nr:hypothetical protein [Planctomycetaceae bacterium]